MSSEDLNSQIVKGTLTFIEEKIKDYAKRFQERKLAFIKNQNTIDLVKEQLKTGEWDLVKKYLKEDKTKILVQMGLTLRALDENKNSKELQNLRDKIIHKYGEHGLHIAQFVQNKILNEFLGSYISTNKNIEDLSNTLEHLLNNLEKQVIFVKTEDNQKELLTNLTIKLTANVPDSFIIFARDSALKNGEKIKDAIFKKENFNYKIEIKMEKQQLMIFLFKNKEKYFNN